MGWEDDRAVSEVLGAILLFGILVTAIGGYQAFVVPQQNAEIEYEHDQRVNNEFPEIQKAISNAAASGEERIASITLGTSYPFRVLSVSGPSPTGNLKTGERSEITVENHDITNTCGLTPNTTSIQYRANYFEYDNAGRFIYENGVTFRQVGDRAVVRTNQELIDGNTVSLHPVSIGNLDRTSTSSEQLQFKPGQTGVSNVTFDSPSNVTLQTHLSKERWAEILDGEDNVTDIQVRNGQLDIKLDAGQYWFECTPVGIGSEPIGQGDVPQDHDERETSPVNEINPAGDGAVTFDGAEMVEDGNNGVTITLRNRGDEDRIVEEIRIPFYSSDGQGGTGGTPGQQVNVTGGDSPDGLVGGEYQPAPATIPADDGSGGDGTEEFTVTFFCGGGSTYGIGEGDFFAMNVLFENGDVAVYFINSPGGISSNPCKGS